MTYPGQIVQTALLQASEKWGKRLHSRLLFVVALAA
jgi:hypothetical protein